MEAFDDGDLFDDDKVILFDDDEVLGESGEFFFWKVESG